MTTLKKHDLTLMNVIMTALLVMAEDGADPSNKEHIKGVFMEDDFDIRKVEAVAQSIQELLDGLPDGFRTDAGIPVTEAHKDVNGVVWARSPKDTDTLITLGLAADLLEFTTPRETWQNYRLPSDFNKIRIRQAQPAGAGSR